MWPKQQILQGCRQVGGGGGGILALQSFIIRNIYNYILYCIITISLLLMVLVSGVSTLRLAPQLKKGLSTPMFYLK